MTLKKVRILFTAGLFALVAAHPAAAQQLSIDFGEGGTLAGRSIELIALITILSLAPGLAMMVTCFPFIVTVLAILRQAIGIQQSPPNMLIVTLAMFLTYFIMEPVFSDAWTNGIVPIRESALPLEEGLEKATLPFRNFMMARVDPDTLTTMTGLRSSATGEPASGIPALSILVPSFLLSEIARAFEIGFLIFLPFLIIDLVVAAILMSMGMMMVPPAVVALPFKLAFFVVADGWSLIASALLRSYQ